MRLSKEETKQLLVSSGSPVKETAGSIVKCYLGGTHDIELRAIGASAVNQMYKSIAASRSILAQRGLDLFIKPGFDEAMINGEKRTVLVARLVIK